jgi:hypothetical protein
MLSQTLLHVSASYDIDDDDDDDGVGTPKHVGAFD